MTPAEIRVRALLAGVMPAAAVEEWLDRWQFRGRSARDLLASGRGEVVLARAEFLVRWSA